MRKPRLFKQSLTLAVLLATLLSCSRGEKGAQLGRVAVQDIEQRISVSGNLRGKRNSFVTPAYSGYIVDLKVKLGDKVKEGAPLFRIAQTVDQPLAQIFPIRAPFSGIVTQLLKSEGEYVTASSTGTSNESAVLRVDDLSEFWLESAVPEIDIAKVKIGLESQIRPNALTGKTYRGTIREIALSAKEPTDRWDRGKVEYAVLIRVEEPDDALRPGMSAVVDIIAARKDQVLTLPHEFIHRREDEYYVVDKAGNEVPIKVGLSNESVIEILSGVASGTEVQIVDFTKVSAGGRSGRSGRLSR